MIKKAEKNKLNTQRNFNDDIIDIKTKRKSFENLVEEVNLENILKYQNEDEEIPLELILTRENASQMSQKQKPFKFPINLKLQKLLQDRCKMYEDATLF